MTTAVSSGSSSFNLQTFNASPNLSITFNVTGLTPALTEKQIATTLARQASSAIVANGALFTGVLGTIMDPVSGNFELAFTDHVVSFFSMAQFDLTQVSDTTGINYYIDSVPVLTTVTEALNYGPLANQLLQSSTGASLTTAQIINLLAIASADIVAILRNNIVSCFYIFELTTNIMDAIRFHNRPIQKIYNPYTLRPTIIALATQTAAFDLQSRYEVDYQTGWCTFRFAQDLLFNYEPFDNKNQWRVAYQAGWNYIPREVKNAILRWSYVVQTFSNISELQDGNTRIKFATDKNIEKRNIFSSLRGVYTQ